MLHTVQCTHCQRKLRLDPKYLGAPVRCPLCKEVFTPPPEPEAPAPRGPAPPPPRAPAAPPAPPPAPRPPPPPAAVQPRPPAPRPPLPPPLPVQAEEPRTMRPAETTYGDSTSPGQAFADRAGVH